jgi:hypothetical protein
MWKVNIVALEDLKGLVTLQELINAKIRREKAAKIFIVQYRH